MSATTPAFNMPTQPQHAAATIGETTTVATIANKSPPSNATMPSSVQAGTWVEQQIPLPAHLGSGAAGVVPPHGRMQSHHGHAQPPAHHHSHHHPHYHQNHPLHPQHQQQHRHYPVYPNHTNHGANAAAPRQKHSHGKQQHQHSRQKKNNNASNIILRDVHGNPVRFIFASFVFQVQMTPLYMCVNSLQFFVFQVQMTPLQAQYLQQARPPSLLPHFGSNASPFFLYLFIPPPWIPSLFNSSLCKPPAHSSSPFLHPTRHHNFDLGRYCLLHNLTMVASACFRHYRCSKDSLIVRVGSRYSQFFPFGFGFSRELLPVTVLVAVLVVLTDRTFVLLHFVKCCWYYRRW
jgi:hypothetical protein